MIIFCIGDRSIAVRRDAKSEDIATANSNIRRNIVYAVTQFVWVCIGIVAMTIPANPYTESDGATQINSILIIVGQFALIFNAIKDHIDRNILLSIIGGRRKTDV
jgi:hypothetical protein